MSTETRGENTERNDREARAGAPKLESTPRSVTLGVHNACNARCIFCLEGDYRRFDLATYREMFEGRMGRFLDQAEEITFTGFGEILWVPGIETFLDHLNERLPDANKIFTTNGTPLTPPILERLARSRYTLQISLHASHGALHESLTGLKGEFDAVLANVRRLIALRAALPDPRALKVQLVDVLTTRNIDDLPALIRLAFDLGVPDLRCQHVTLFTPEHIELSCFFQQARANDALKAAEREALLQRAAAAASSPPWDFRVSLPTRFGGVREPDGAKPFCGEPWQNVYVELQGSVLPCCYWGEHVGNLAGDSLESLWNGPFYQDLRSRMASGKPHPWCASCVRYTGYNVDDLFCHLTTRPDARRRLLAAIDARRSGPDPLPRAAGA